MKTTAIHLPLRSIACFLAVLWLAGARAQTTYSANYDFAVDGCFYRIISETEKTVALTYQQKAHDEYDDTDTPVSGYTGSVTIPSTVACESGTYAVTQVDDHTFECSSVTSVTVSEGVLEIGASAFYDCQTVKAVTLPQSVTSIGAGAFNGCIALASVNIPDGVTMIEASTFSFCKSLPSIAIPDNVTEIRGSAFLGCSKLTSAVLPRELTFLGPYAFNGCSSLRSVSIPEGVTTIGTLAFAYCTSLTAVSVFMKTPVALTDNMTFSNAANATLYVPRGCKDAYGQANWWRNFGTIAEMLSDGETFTEQTVEGVTLTFRVTSALNGTCEVLSAPSSLSGSVTIPATASGYRVTRIGNQAFRKLSGLTEVTIPVGIEEIGYEAFEKCYNLTSVYIPDGVTTISFEAFHECSSLLSARVPGSLKTKNGNIFKECYKLSSVTLEEGMPYIGYNMFEKCAALTSINIPSSVDSIMDGAFMSSRQLASVKLPSGLKYIGQETFYNCSSLTSLSLPSGITAINAQTFQGCTGLTSIDIPDGVTTIDIFAFYGCTGLTSIDIPDGVTTIGGDAFHGCTGLTSIVIPDGVTTIGPSAFQGCTGFTSVTLPEGITDIAATLFKDCTNLASIGFSDEVNSVGTDAFANTAWFNSQPDGLVYAGKVAYKFKGEMAENTVIELEEGTRGISGSAFLNCANLVQITIPGTVAVIGPAAFSGCSSLSHVYVGMATPVTISLGTFSSQGDAFLHVPVGSKQAYMSAPVWQDFLCIKELNAPELYSGGSGTEADPYLISEVGDMKFLAYNVNKGNSYKDAFFEVNVPELDFANTNFLPIGGIRVVSTTNIYNAFAGSFNGNDVVIKNMVNGRGLFHCLSKEGSVSGVVTDESCRIDASAYDAAGIVAVNYGTIANCVNKADVTSDMYHVGGICGDNMGTITGCKNYGTITSTNKDTGMTGGIAGDLDGGQIVNCENYGKVTVSSGQVGGIVGLVTQKTSLTDGCMNCGNVSGQFCVGGISGDNTNYNATISNCLVRNCEISSAIVYNIYNVGAVSSNDNATFSNNFYTPDVIVRVASKVVDGLTPRGVWDGSELKDIEKNNGAVLLVMGDVNGDRSISAQDASLVLQLVAGKLDRNAEGIICRAADVNGDGQLSAQDASLILQYVAGKIQEFK